VVDSESTKTTESGAPRVYGAGKRVKGHKLHAMMDAYGRALVLDVHPDNVKYRDGAPPLLGASRCGWPFVALAFADAGYAGEHDASTSPTSIEIVRKPDGQVGFAVHTRRWVVERFFSWVGCHGRSAKDFEASVA
jgi:transposase